MSQGTVVGESSILDDIHLVAQVGNHVVIRPIGHNGKTYRGRVEGISIRLGIYNAKNAPNERSEWLGKHFSSVSYAVNCGRRDRYSRVDRIKRVTASEIELVSA